MKVLLFLQSRKFSSLNRLTTGVFAATRRRGWILQVTTIPDTARELRDVIALRHPDGCIIDLSSGEPPPARGPLDGIPTVLYNGCGSGDPAWLRVNQRNEEIAALAARTLVTPNRRAYAYVLTPKFKWSLERGRLFRREIVRRGLPFSYLDSENPGPGLLAMPKPAAVFAANDHIALVLMMAAENAGVKVPDEVTVLGVDNEDIYCENTTPGISSLDLELETTGRILVDSLAAEMERTGVPRELRLPPPRLVRRGSTSDLGLFLPGVTDGLECIRRGLASPELDIDEVACAMKCRRRLATERFRVCTGQTIAQAIANARHARLCELLRTTNMKISSVIYECGYDCESYPKRIFLKRTGLTMSQYRAKSNAGA